MTDLRDVIARALSTQTTCDGEPHPSELHYRQTDAVLAVLADLPDDVIEQAAGRFRKLVLKCDCIRCENVAEKHVKNTFAAVFGGEQA